MNQRENRHTVSYKSKRKIDGAERLPQWQRSRFDASGGPAGWTRTINQLLARRWKPSQGVKELAQCSFLVLLSVLPLSTSGFLSRRVSRKTLKISSIQKWSLLNILSAWIEYIALCVCGLSWLCDLSKYLSSTDSWITNVWFLCTSHRYSTQNPLMFVFFFDTFSSLHLVYALVHDS